MNSITVKVMGVVLSIFILLMVGSQFVYFVSDSSETEEAVLYTVDESASFRGMFVRDEKVIEYDGDGILQFNVSDASKLSTDSVIAYVYDDEQQIYYKSQIEKLTSLKEDYEKAQNPGTTSGIETEALRTKISQQYMELIESCDSEDYGSVCSVRKELMYLLNLNNIITRNDTDFSEQITELESMISEYESLTVDPKDTITSNDSGYFASTLDGYEGLVSISDIEYLTEERIDSLFNAEPETSENAIGKIISEYDTKFIGVIEKSNKLVELSLLSSNSVSVRFSSSDNVYTMSIDTIRPIDQNEEEYLIVLDCTVLDETLLQNRFENAELVFDEYTGVKVPREAIRFKDGVKGVYTLFGQETTFKKIDVIYEGDDFVLSSNTEDTAYVNVYDQMLLEGG
ncbi:MAG: hypothetical protein LUC25_05320 [Ruminococcus sp.]|nr:hypothetical protein [Ruminococcus sp.]